MDSRPIHTEADYTATLKEISVLMDSDPDPGTPEGDRLDILVTLVQAYEAKHMPVTAADQHWQPNAATVVPDHERWLHGAQAASDLARALEWSKQHPASDDQMDTILAAAAQRE